MKIVFTMFSPYVELWKGGSLVKFWEDFILDNIKKSEFLWHKTTKYLIYKFVYILIHFYSDNLHVSFQADCQLRYDLYFTTMHLLMSLRYFGWFEDSSMRLLSCIHHLHRIILFVLVVVCMLRLSCTWVFNFFSRSCVFPSFLGSWLS